MSRSMYRQIITPDKDNHTIDLPEEFFGKKLEVIMVELDKSVQKPNPIPPTGKEISSSDILSSFGDDPDFPATDELRSKKWPSKW